MIIYSILLYITIMYIINISSMIYYISYIYVYDINIITMICISNNIYYNDIDN